MFDRLIRERPDGCLSDLTIDTAIAGELPRSHAARVAEHITQCPRCRSKRDAFLDDAHAMFPNADRDCAGAGEEPAVGLGPQPTQARPRGRQISSASGSRPTRGVLMGFLTMAVLAAGVLLSVRHHAPVAPGASTALDAHHASGERTKGSASFGFFVKHRELVFRGQAGGTVPASASIRFVYSSERAAYLSIISRDPQGAFSAYYPQGLQAAPILPGRDVALDSAVQLDDSLGPETLWALFCDAPEVHTTLVSALRAHPDSDARTPEGCQVQELHFVKVAP